MNDCPGWGKKTATAHAVHDAGFCYVSSQDIIVSRLHAPQQYLGYTWAYDVAAPKMSMIIDCEPIYFRYDNRNWLIELWKGQYGLETGCEIGVYSNGLPSIPPGGEKFAFYNVDTTNLFHMSFTLKNRKTGEVILHRNQWHWWLTGFKWGVYTADPRHHLIMDVTIALHSTEMCEKFVDALQNQWRLRLGPHHAVGLGKEGYHPIVNGQQVSFQFGVPKTPQPTARLIAEPKMQVNNYFWVQRYNDLKKRLGLQNNDPNNFDLSPLGHTTRSAVRSAVRHHTPAPVRHLGRKVAAHIPHHMRHSHNEHHEEHDVFEMFHNKVWHNKHHPGNT